ncbi:sporulation protein YpjB [Halobacillus sp. A5]|uniref:sporulation protein YpjB n=1 Tax=Halobacillus sp. A5 TaxID=2880263 RepID=UPI0020A6AB27|nr:sporulation protein YpjB [Halobacillus sp. A5]MCP3025872.1 hypothetical protein [Halobacillus sp. A5]
MGRAVLIVSLTLLGFMFAYSQWVSADTKDKDWSAFVAQYTYLIADGKYELAEKMLENRYEDLAVYYEERSPAHRETFDQLAENVKRDSYEAQSLIQFFEFSLTSDEEKAVIEKLKEIQLLVENSDADRTIVMDEWTSLSPVIGITFPEADVESVSNALENYYQSNTLNSQQTVLYYLKELIPEETERTYDAFIWTAAIISGTIIVTLAYVGYRKYKAEKAQQRKKQKLNS